MSETIVRAVADASDSDPLELDECLFDAVDPGALETLFDSGLGDAERRVSFTFAGYRVAVDESRTVHLTDARHRSNAGPISPSQPSPAVLRGSGSPWRLVFEQ